MESIEIEEQETDDIEATIVSIEDEEFAELFILYEGKEDYENMFTTGGEYVRSK